MAWLLPLLAQAQDRTISGTVRDEKTKPFRALRLLSKPARPASPRARSAMPAGVFKVSNVPAGISFSVIISFIGYETQTRGGHVKPGSAPLTVQLKESASVLEQVVVIGYGSQRRREITGAIASVRAADLKDQPVANLEQAIAGKLAGVQVLQNSGAPGGSMSIRIRGLNSISAGTDPLYVIDGFPISNDLKNLQGSTDLINISGISSFQKSPNPMSTLNPDDIESIEVLKDASSASIYGSRASNGVILVTTKRGKKRRQTVVSATVHTAVFNRRATRSN
jgi:TonB-dependent SusC/RagA subfamily outer membrane receptor